jgi:phosphoesterase RecJ-like protein
LAFVKAYGENMLKKIIEKVNQKRSFLITSHMNLEGDALGSELATYILLKKLKKKVVIFNNDNTPDIYKFLPFSDRIKNNLDNSSSFDVAFVLDCSDASRVGRVKDYLSKCDCIINIDHHISNTSFGDMNWVEWKRSSTCEMIYQLCKKINIIDRNIAFCLYTGIFTDTGNFTYANTDRNTHRIISNLMRYNISPHRVYENIHSLCDLYDLKFIGKVISSLKFDTQRKICWAKIKRWEEKEYDLTEVIFSIMRLLKGIEVFILFKKIDGDKVRVNFRSRSKVDVNKIAQFFGGGGHKRASGTTINGTMESIEKKVISFTRRYTTDKKL